MRIIYDEHGQITWPCSTCEYLETSNRVCDKEKCLFPKAYQASKEFHRITDVHVTSEEMVEYRMCRCLTCGKQIDKNKPHVVAYKNGLPAYFCREHFDGAKGYLER